MKKLFAVLLSICFWGVSVNAQVNRNVTPAQKVQKESHHKNMRGQMMKELNLTPAQKAQMKELHQSMKSQMDAVKNDASLTPEQKKAKMKELHLAQKEKMSSMLTPEQREKMKAEKKEWKDKNKDKNKDKKNMRAPDSPQEK